MQMCLYYIYQLISVRLDWNRGACSVIDGCVWQRKYSDLTYELTNTENLGFDAMTGTTSHDNNYAPILNITIQQHHLISSNEDNNYYKWNSIWTYIPTVSPATCATTVIQNPNHPAVSYNNRKMT